MKKLLLSLILLINGCDQSSVENTFAEVQVQNQRKDLQDIIYLEEMVPFMPLMEYASGKTRDRQQSVSFAAFRLNENSISWVVNLLMPLKGYYTAQNCEYLQGNESILFLPEAIGLNLYQQMNDLDTKSIRVQAMLIRLQESLEKIAKQFNVELKEKSLHEELSLKLFDPRAIYCAQLTQNDLANLRQNFVKFNATHKPADFNEKLLQHK